MEGYLLYDVIIVGSGPGGASVALSSAKFKLKTLVLEWGQECSLGNIWSLLRVSGMPGKGFYIDRDLFFILRAITLGGSSAINFATAFPPPQKFFDKYGIDLSSYIDVLSKKIISAPLGDHLIGPMASRIENAALDLKLPWKRLNKFIYQEKCRTECHRCIYGCPHGAKWHPGMLIKDAITAGIHFRHNAKVTKVIVENGTAIGVEYFHNGNVYRAYGKNIVVSAGGLGTPNILRESGLREVGDQLFVDPVIAAIGVVPEIVGSGREVPMASGLINYQAGYTLSDMALPAALHHLFSGMVGRLTSHKKSLTVMVKGRDSLDGFIAKNGYPIKKLSCTDNMSLKSGTLLAKEILQQAGAKSSYLTRPFAAHPGGTVAIGKHLDSNLSTRYRNLYVCDSSVIPEPWGYPPSLTLLSLGMRLANHITSK